VRGFDLISRTADAYQERELRPGVSVEIEGKPFSINQFGMRDRDSVSLYKPAGTTRVALLGSSIVMGYGVGDDEVFARLFEDQLNAAHGGAAPHFEVLNFGVGGQWAINRLVRAQRVVFGFEPDVLIYFAHQDEYENIDSHLTRLLGDGLPLPSPYLVEAARDAGVTPGLSGGAIQGPLQLHRAAMLSAVYRSIAEECRSRDVLPVYVYLPMPGFLDDDPGGELLPLARDAGFQSADLTGWAGDTPPAILFGDVDTDHPNAEGHRLIAAALLRLVSQRPELLPVNDEELVAP
jgi:hypothetical protein